MLLGRGVWASESQAHLCKMLDRIQASGSSQCLVVVQQPEVRVAVVQPALPGKHSAQCAAARVGARASLPRGIYPGGKEYVEVWRESALPYRSYRCRDRSRSR